MNTKQHPPERGSNYSQVRRLHLSNSFKILLHSQSLTKSSWSGYLRTRPAITAQRDIANRFSINHGFKSQVLEAFQYRFGLHTLDPLRKFRDAFLSLYLFDLQWLQISTTGSLLESLWSGYLRRPRQLREVFLNSGEFGIVSNVNHGKLSRIVLE